MDYRDYNEKLLDSSTRYMEDGMRAWERYLQVMSDATKGDYKVDEVQKKFMEFAQHEGSETMKKLMQSSFDYYLSLINAALEFNQHTVEALSENTESQAEQRTSDGDIKISSGTTKKPQNMDLHFTAIKGKLQKEGFVVANMKAEDVEVSFEVSELICEDGISKLSTPVSFDPDHFLLRQGEEQVVECRLKLNKPLQAGLQYAALARVVGFQDLFVRMIIDPER